MKLNYEIVYRPGLKHQVPDALSRLPRRESLPEEEVDEEIPTFVDNVEEARLVNVTTRRQSQQVDDDPQPLTKDAAPPSVPAAEPRPQDIVEREPKPRPLVRAGKVNHKRDHAWVDTSYLPLPDEDDDDDVYDLVAEARDAILAGRFEHEGHDHAHVTRPDEFHYRCH